MSNDNEDTVDGTPDQPVAWAIMGVNCTTSMAVAAGASAGALIPVVAAGVVLGLALNALERDEGGTSSSESDPSDGFYYIS